MIPTEKREKARLRSERWRRAHGIMPRRPAQRPLLAEGISQSARPPPIWPSARPRPRKHKGKLLPFLDSSVLRRAAAGSRETTLP